MEHKTGKLIMNKGLPRSGKSTWAKEFVAASGNAVIISRDDLRVLLHDGKWTPRNEKTTINAQKALAAAMLKEGKVVIIDDTNLTAAHQQRWEQFAKEHNAGFEVKHHKESDLMTLIDRDFKSGSPRGAHVIKKMALGHGYVHFPDNSVVICDIDGTVADLEHRRHMVIAPHNAQNEDCRWRKYWEEPDSLKCDAYCPHPEHKCDCTQTDKTFKKNWDEFFRMAPWDKPIDSTIASVKALASEGKTIIFVSARPERCRKDTMEWLLKYGLADVHVHDWEHDDRLVPYFALLMRADGDSRDDVLTKQEILDKYLKKDWILKVFDDRPKVIRMWRSNGLEVEDVGTGEEF